MYVLYMCTIDVPVLVQAVRVLRLLRCRARSVANRPSLRQESVGPNAIALSLTLALAVPGLSEDNTVDA